jgi:hypothetical protein
VCLADGDHRSDGRFLEAIASFQAKGALLMRPALPTAGFFLFLSRGLSLRRILAWKASSTGHGH